MIIVSQAPLFLIFLFIAGLAYAAVEDIYRRRVSNLAVLIVAGSGIAAFIATGQGLRLWEPLVVAIGVLALGTLLFAKGLMGGGDIKLMAAGCFWYVLRGQLAYLTSALMAGGALALAVLALRWWRQRGDQRLGRKSVGIPYAVAIAAGAAWTVYSVRLA